MRTTQDIREKLEASAARSGRSLTHEVEFRVGQALDLDEKLGSAAAAEFHQNIGKLLHLLPLDAFLNEPGLARSALVAGVLELVRLQFPETRGGLAFGVETPDPDRVQQVERAAHQIAQAVMTSSHLYEIASGTKQKGADALRFREGPAELSARLLKQGDDGSPKTLEGLMAKAAPKRRSQKKNED